VAFTDNFTESSDTALESHTPSGGSSWTLVSGSSNSISVNAAGDLLRVNNIIDAVYTHDDQGSADQYIIFRAKGLTTSYPNSYVCCRLVDNNNFIGWRLFGTASAGRRLSKNVAGVVTDLISSQGVDEEFIKIEVDGTTAKFFEGGTGGTPSWTQIGIDQTYSENTTETSQGLRSSDSTSIDWIDDYEAGSLAAGGTTGKSNPMYGPFGGPLAGVIS